MTTAKPKKRIFEACGVYSSDVDEGVPPPVTETQFPEMPRGRVPVPPSSLFDFGSVALNPSPNGGVIQALRLLPIRALVRSRTKRGHFSRFSWSRLGADCGKN